MNNKESSSSKKIGYRNQYGRKGKNTYPTNLKNDNEKKTPTEDSTFQEYFAPSFDRPSLIKDSSRRLVDNDKNILKNVNRHSDSFAQKKTYVQELFNKDRNKKGAPTGNIRVVFSSEKKRRKELKKRIVEHICMRKKKKKRKEFEERRKFKELLNAKIQEEREKGLFYILPKHLRIKKKSKLKKTVLLEKEIKNEIGRNLLERKRMETLHADLCYLLKNRKKWNIHKIAYVTERLSKKTRDKDNTCIMCISPQRFSNYLRKRISRTIIHNKKSERLVKAKTIKEKFGNNQSGNNNINVHGEFRRNNVFKEMHGKIKKNEKTVDKHDSAIECEKEEELIREDADRAVLKKQIEKNSEIIRYIKKTQIEKKLFINSYVNHEITEEFNSMVKDFLIKIKKSHDKYLQKNKKRYYLGLKESYKHICINEPKLVIIAPNIEPLQNNAFGDMIQKIVLKCKDKNIPFVYALSRNSLGKCLNTLRQSIVCIMHIDSFEKECQEIIKMSEFLKRVK